MDVTPKVREILFSLAQKYIWWKPVDESIKIPQRIAAQVMDIGDFDDVRLLEKFAGRELLRFALTHAEAGQFSPRSWNYWHYRLGLCEIGAVPALPQRNFKR